MNKKEQKYIKRSIVSRFYDGGRYYPGTYKDIGIEAVVNFLRKFPLRSFVDYSFYQPRKNQRYIVLRDRLFSFVGEKVLDVGSRDDSAECFLGKKVVLIDKNNTNLDKWDWEKHPIPFEDESFDTVICFDTLEHINDIHGSFEDLMRVTKGTLLISLPNCWKKQIKKMLTLHPGQASYGIPPEKPMDRHKWFFNTEDVDNFLTYSSSTYKKPFEVIHVIYHAPKTVWWHYILYPTISHLAPQVFKNYFVETIFFVLKRRAI